MNNEQFRASMARILSFTQAPKTTADTDHLNRYLAALYEAIWNMDAYLFEKVTVELAKNMGRGQRPMPSQIWAVYPPLKGEAAAAAPAVVCPSCKNTVWTMVRMMETKTGVEMDFAEPCAACQHRHPLKDAAPRSGWIKVERQRSTHDQEMLDKAKAMGPKGARFVLDMIDQGKVKFSDEVILELVTRAGDQPSQPNHAVAAVLEKLTVTPAPAREQPTGEGSPEQEPVDWEVEA